jgi:hypothetical protein
MAKTFRSKVNAGGKFLKQPSPFLVRGYILALFFQPGQPHWVTPNHHGNVTGNNVESIVKGNLAMQFVKNG